MSQTISWSSLFLADSILVAIGIGQPLKSIPFFSISEISLLKCALLALFN